jgi:predicted Fe-S protein YdhL (DUF1289 family)
MLKAAASAPQVKWLTASVAGAGRLSGKPALPTFVAKEATKPQAANQRLILSPCIKVCAIDVVTGLCVGCGRTRAEIADWSAMPEAERERIMAELRVKRRRTAAESNR